MRLKRVEHVAIAVKDMDAAKRVFEDVLGLALEHEEEIPRYQTKLAFYPVGETYLELLQATSEASETAQWIAARGEGFYHLCFEVDDLEAALAELNTKGVRLLDERPRLGHANTRIAFLDPGSTVNVLMELVEVPKGQGPAPETPPAG
jgi:methylmalonyl-CoA/ethylmalonyl-CoA epimerase